MSIKFNFHKYILVQLLMIYNLSISQRCGNSGDSVRIIGGKPANPLSWPWMALLNIQFTKVGGTVTYRCGGTLISDYWILTAAHCLKGKTGETLKRIGITLAEHDISRHEGREIQLFGVQNVTNNYNPRTNENDIALIKMNQKLDFKSTHSFLQPICLPNNLNVSKNKCYATGWGNTVNGGKPSSTLQEVELPIMDDNYCSSVWRSSFKPQSMLCAGYREGGKDTCQGDSGGPLACPLSNGVWIQYGITSFGDQCAQREKPGIYTRVSYYVNWINKVIATQT